MKVPETVKAREQADFIGEKMRQLEELKEEIEKEHRKYSEQRFPGSGNGDRAPLREDGDKMEDGVFAVSHNSVGYLQELCTARGLGLPRYNELAAPLMSSATPVISCGGRFSIQCLLGTEATTGYGPNKVENPCLGMIVKFYQNTFTERGEESCCGSDDTEGFRSK